MLERHKDRRTRTVTATVLPTAPSPAPDFSYARRRATALRSGGLCPVALPAESLGVIALGDSGYAWLSLVGGPGCVSAWAKGVYLPLSLPLSARADPLSHHTWHPDDNDYSYNDFEVARFLRVMGLHFLFAPLLAADLTKTREWTPFAVHQSGWVPVQVLERAPSQGTSYSRLALAPLQGKPAVLVYPQRPRVDS